MLLVIPFRKNAECRSFICDTATLVKPDHVFTTDINIVKTPGAVDKRYSKLFNDVKLHVGQAKVIMQNALKIKNKNVIVLLELQHFEALCMWEEELREVIQRTALYPREYELKTDLTRLALKVTGAVV